MKVAERDELIIRTHEQTLNTWRVVEKMEAHQREQNGFIGQALTLSKSNRTWIGVIRYVGSIIGSIVIAVLGWLLYNGV